MKNAESVISDVKLEFASMKEIGMRVPAKAVKFLSTTAAPAKVMGYYDNGMSVSEIADMLIDLAGAKCL